MMAYRKQPSLGNLLGNSKITYPKIPTQSNRDPPVCKKSPAKCTRCIRISRTPALHCSRRNKDFSKLPRPRPAWITCKITNVIYCITCRKCNIQYIGQTSREFGQRIYEHVYSVAHPTTKRTPVSGHFSKNGHTSSDLKFSVVEWIKGDPSSTKPLRLKREDHWIWSFRTLHPYGLNQMM